MPKKKTKAPRRAISFGETALACANSTDVVALMAGFGVSVNGLSIEGDPGFEQCAAVGRLLPVAERAIQFALGDYINYMELRFGEQASQVIDYQDGWSERTCLVYAWLAKRVEPERRRMDRLSVKHHLLVAGLSPTLQSKWLTKAAADEEEMPWTSARLKTEMEGAGEVPPTYWVLASAVSEQDQSMLQAQLEATGRSCKAMVKRRRSKV